MRKVMWIIATSLMVLLAGFIALAVLVPTTPETQEATGAIDPTATPMPEPDMENALAEVMEAVNTFNSDLGQQFFTGAEIKESGRRLELTVTDVWYTLPKFQKERAVQTFADRYAHIAARNNLRGDNPDAGNYPTTSFVDTFGNEV